MNITIHSGEATGNEEIMMALNNGAQRIGHGVHLSLDEQSVNRVLSRPVCFEFCPTSNLQTKSLKGYSDVPLRKFIEKSIPVTINSDNMTVSNTDAIQDMKQMVKTFSLTKEEVYKLLETAINYSFASFFTKKKLISRLKKNFESYYQKIL